MTQNQFQQQQHFTQGWAVIADATLVNIQMCHVQGGKMPRGPALLNMETLLCAIVALSLIANDLIIPSA